MCSTDRGLCCFSVGGIHLTQYSHLQSTHQSLGKAPPAPFIVKVGKYSVIYHIWKWTSTYDQVNYTSKVLTSHWSVQTCLRHKCVSHRYLKLVTWIHFSSLILTQLPVFPLSCSPWLPTVRDAPITGNVDSIITFGTVTVLPVTLCKEHAFREHTRNADPNYLCAGVLFTSVRIYMYPKHAGVHPGAPPEDSRAHHTCDCAYSHQKK